MRDTQNFDAFIKGEFENYAPEVSPKIWDKIVAERSKRKPAGFWINFLNSKNMFLLIGALVVASGAVVYSLKNKISQNNPDKSISTTVNNQISNQSGISSTTGSNISSGSSSNATATVNGQQETTPVKENTINNNQPVTPQQDKLFTQNNQSDKSVKKLYSIPANQNDISENNTTGTTVNRDETQQISNRRKGTITNARSKTSVNISTGSSLSADNNIIEAKINKDEPPAEINTPLFGGTLLNRLQSGIDNIQAEKQLLLSTKQVEMKPAAFPGCPTIEKESKRNQYVEMYAGPDFIFRSFSDTPNSTYLIKRKESTQLLSAYSAGLRYTKVYKNGLSFKVGINYSQINEKFTFVLNNFSQVTYTTDPVTGDTTGSFITRGNAKKNTYNHYRSIDLPLLAGYELSAGNFHINFNAGAIVNIYSWQKGEVMGLNNKPVNITTGKASLPYQYKTNIGLGLTAGVSVYYQLTDYLHLMLEPNFRYNLSPVNKNNISLKQRNNALGIRFGIRVDLK